MTASTFSGHPGIGKELLVITSEMSKRLVFQDSYWSMCPKSLTDFYRKLCACMNSVYLAIFYTYGLGMRL